MDPFNLVVNAVILKHAMDKGVSVRGGKPTDTLIETIGEAITAFV
jgi:hypothetical protein